MTTIHSLRKWLPTVSSTFFLVHCWAITGGGIVAAEPNGLAVDQEVELPRIAPTSPEAALETFRVADGFRIELAAAEPLVVDPVALDFDENGQLFVAEMRGYSEHAAEHLGRIRLLVDEDGDGRFDRSSVYAEGLSWPTAVACYDGGVFVGAAPDIIYLKDTDNDQQADVRQTVLTGFGTDNVQGLLNSFRWGLDNRIHVAASSCGGSVHSTLAGDPRPVALNGGDFAIDPRSRRGEVTTGGGQFGMSFNRWGEKFVCSNSDHVQMILAENRYLRRNPYQAGPTSRRSIAVDGPQAAVFRISPVEPWRIVRTRWRVAGLVPGPVEGGGTAAGYFTSATGITIYEGDAWPASDRGTGIVADVGSNIIHRKRLERTGVAYVAHRIDSESEFVASSDIWFRPVQFCNGPDGALYVADMYREVVEHPASLPPEIKQHLDLQSGFDRGRIYRIVPTNFERRKIPRLSDATSSELIAMLDHLNAWHRRTAARLVYQRQDRTIVPELIGLATGGQLPEGRIAALHALEGLAALDEKTLLVSLSDAHPQVRRHAVLLSERFASSSTALRAKLLELVDDPEITVRYQLAFSLGEWNSPQAVEGLVALARRDIHDENVKGALLSSMMHDAPEVVAKLQQDAEFATSTAGAPFLEALRYQVRRQQSASEAVDIDDIDLSYEDEIAVSNELIAQREEIYRSYQNVLSQHGDANQGKLVFKQTCASCHELEQVGTAIGPNLATMKNRGPEVMLYNILVPSRSVERNFQNHLIITQDGRALAGIIGEETATSVKLVGPNGVANTILRIDIDELVNTGESMMPTGFEKLIDRQAMADLITYLMSVR